MIVKKSPPEGPPSFEGFTFDTVLAQTEAILSSTATLHRQLATASTPADATFDNVIRPIVDDANRAACRLTILSDLLSQLSPSHEIRHAARLAQSRITAGGKNTMRKDIAKLVSAVHARETANPSGHLDAQDQRILSNVYEQYAQSGSGSLGDEECERLDVASKELNELCVAAQNSLIEPEEGIWFERSELEGIPERILATMVEDGSRIQVTFRKDHAAAVMWYVTSNETRRRFTIANWHRLPENVERLNKTVALRDEIARLLRFDNHAALKIGSRMAPSVSYVQARLEELHKKLEPVAQAETNSLLKIKRNDPNTSEGPISELYEWEEAYYILKQKSKDSSGGRSKFAEYFETNHTLRGMLSLLQDLFVYQVWDIQSEGGAFLGYFYADLFEREGKYRGAHCIGIQPGFLERSGRKHYPATALVCCYARPTQSGPSLLQHNEVTTIFHELGHAIHNLVTRTKYSFGRSRDYSEIPSMMLENWAWIPDVLIRISRHYSTLDAEHEQKKALPRWIAKAVCRGRNEHRANAILAHIWPALFDLAIHTPSTRAEATSMDTTEIWNRTKRRILTTSAGNNPRDWGHGQSRFIHMFRHNDVGYFSYPLSMAYAVDLFTAAFAKNPMSAVAGRSWRYQVLEPGSSRPEWEILSNFLGREPSIKAIVDELNT